MSVALKVLSEPRRVELLRLVWDQERCAGDLSDAFDVSFAAVSQHLAKLRRAGLVEVRREGRHRYYRARKDQMGSLADYLETMWKARLGQLKELAEAEERKNR